MTLAGLAVHLTSAGKQPGSPKQHWWRGRAGGAGHSTAQSTLPACHASLRQPLLQLSPGVGHRRETHPTSPGLALRDHTFRGEKRQKM